MKYRFFLIAAAALGTLTAHALEVQMTAAGTLAHKGIDASVTTLSLTGDVDASDLYYIGNTLTSLQNLDMSRANIVAYLGKSVGGSQSHKAATFPVNVFAGLPLRTIAMPAGNVTIGDGAFAGTSLTAIDLSRVDSIGQGAFAACKSLTAVAPATDRLGSHIFDQCTALSTADLGAVTHLPPYTFSRCTALEQVTSTQTLASIGDGAFSGCTSLATLATGKPLRSLGAGAFEMSGLTAIDLSAATSLTAIGDRCFAVCPRLESVTLPVSVSSLGRGTFFDDAALTQLDIPDGLTQLEARSLKGAGLSGDITLPEGLEKIDDNALRATRAITSVKLPSTLQSIGHLAMADMTSLKTIDVTSLASAPALGVTVWSGIDQSKVNLDVVDTVAGSFEDAEQWRDFHFNINSGIDNITPDTPGDVAPLRARFSGTDLIVSILGDTTIDDLSLYDPAGRMLASVSPDSDNVVIDTADMDTRIFIITARLGDGRRASLKLAR